MLFVRATIEFPSALLELELEAMAPIEHAGKRAREWECCREVRHAYTIKSGAATERRAGAGSTDRVGAGNPSLWGRLPAWSTAKGVVDMCRLGRPKRWALLD